MKRYHTLLVLIAVLTFVSACEKVNFGEDGGITEKDTNNRPTGHVDSSDWSSDATWKKQELELFKSLKLDLNGTQQGGVQEISLFPNPVATVAQFSVRRPGSATRQAWVVVDRKYKVVQDYAEGPLNYSYQLDFSSLKKGETYRMYYVFYSGNTLYSKGHGDIRMAD
ncbi:hypothetical protein [Hymenobacter metallilatus]|uniref:Lipoprotein n=1 Tax=Hymenobacter metallilatus TaxID=2493666 RepID=A0A3R9NKC5_9BACT|nr:hypothetical protein [Hymenobacter metallilatus]RSK35253.1 hypothetical protein EI290_06020 [Hymenobacter metallilatus]